MLLILLAADLASSFLPVNRKKTRCVKSGQTSKRMYKDVPFVKQTENSVFLLNI